VRSAARCGDHLLARRRVAPPHQGAAVGVRTPPLGPGSARRRRPGQVIVISGTPGADGVAARRGTAQTVRRAARRRRSLLSRAGRGDLRDHRTKWAGKTTAFNLISGVLRPTRGTVYLRGRKISDLPAYRRAALGVGRTFQTPNVFPDLTVLENVMVGLHRLTTTSLTRARLGLGRRAVKQ